MDEYGAILDQVRASIAAGRAPDWSVLESRVKAVAEKPRAHLDPERERWALAQLKLLASVQRARARVAPVAPARTQPGGRPPALRDRPTITGNMDVQRETDGATFRLRWNAVAGVTTWEVRFSERTEPRGAYAVREEVELPTGATSVEVPLGTSALRVHLLGRDRSGRLVQRAVMSSLTRASWSERWQRRASAA